MIEQCKGIWSVPISHDKPPLSPETIEVIRGNFELQLKHKYTYDSKISIEYRKNKQAQQEFNAVYGGSE